ncbi:hypothetical protein ACLQ3B_04650 [Micromonospora sp. DT53]|uniref:hypothetical protein n=1 Tax=Micromonospora sp. DT53 TaxID=3393444 RepID=UPI003CF4CED3
MTSEELREIERTLRHLLMEHDMAWVLENVDRAFVEGVLQERPVDRVRRVRLDQTYEDLRAAWEPRGAVDLEDVVVAGGQGTSVPSPSTTGNTGVTVRSHTHLERVLLIIDSMQRVLVELPEAVAQTYARLAEATAGELSGFDLEFASDMEESSPEKTRVSSGQRRRPSGRHELEQDRQRRDQLNWLLNELKQEAQS